MRSLLIAALPAILCAPRLPAQDFRATIKGQVADPHGAAIVGAKVRAVQRTTNQATEAVTNEDGFYTLSYLAPSTYDIEVIAEGFAKLRRENINLMVAEKLDLPLRLEVGQTATQVTVVAESAELVQTGDASGGLNFDALQTSEYPLNGRQVYMLMDLAPGVLFTQEQFGASGFSGTRGWDTNGSYVMNGGVSGSNSFSLNGAPISLTGSWQVAPNVDAIQEFKIMMNTYDAAIGRTGGGSVNTTLKSGSNKWNGTLFEFLRNSILDANYTQNKQVGAPRGKHITNQFGGTLGGRIRRDKDFVFFSFEGFTERVPFPVVANVPPLDLREGGFSRYNIQVYDPLTGHTCVNNVDLTGTCASTFIRTPFPGNVLPQSRISPIGKNFLSYYPAPNTTGVTQNYVAANSTGKYHYYQPMGRWDRVLNERNRVYGLVTFQHGQEYRNQTGIPGLAASGNINSQRTNMNYIAAWTRILSPSAIMDVRASYGRFTSWFPDADVASGITAKELGMTGSVHAPTSTTDFPPRLLIDQYSNLFGNGSNLYTWSTDNQWNVVPTITVSRGAKTIKFGAEFVYAARASGSIGQANGQLQFTRYGTQRYPLRAGNTSDGAGVADVLLGIPGTGLIDWNDTYYRTWPYFAFFIQNDWKIRENLTLNLGLRYDVQVPFVERWDRVNNGFDFNARNPVSDQVLAVWARNKQAYDRTNPRFPYPDVPAALLGGKTFVQPGGSRRTYLTDWQNLQPRIGIAWRFAPRTVLRTGFGIFHRTATQGNYTDGFSQQTAYARSLDGDMTPSAGLTGPYSLQNPFPNGITEPTGRELGLRTNLGNAVSFDGAQRPIPRTFQYSFGIQRQVFWRVLIDASYVGSMTTHDSMAYNMGYVPMDAFLQGQAVPNYLDRTVNNPFYGILPANSTFGTSSTIAARDLYRFYPLYNGITMSTNPWTRYRYDSLQLRVDKRFRGDRSKSGALSMTLAYTFSKQFQDASRLNNWNLSEQPVHELVSYDKPQNISFHGIWDIPFGKRRHFLNNPNKIVDPLISGWTVNWILRYTSGNPVAGMDVIDFCGNLLIEGQTHDRWFNNDRTCYRTRASYTLRTAPDRYAWLRQMDNMTMNLAASKTFTLTERWKFNFRAEAFNLLNHPLYAAPDTGFQNARFGMLPVGQQNFPRLIQMSAKLMF